MCEFHIPGLPTHFQEKLMDNPFPTDGSTQHHWSFHGINLALLNACLRVRFTYQSLSGTLLEMRREQRFKGRVCIWRKKKYPSSSYWGIYFCAWIYRQRETQHLDSNIYLHDCSQPVWRHLKVSPSLDHIMVAFLLKHLHMWDVQIKSLIKWCLLRFILLG